MKPRVPLGKLLLDHGYIDEFQFKAAVGHQRRYGGKLASLIYTLGFVPERTLLVLLCQQLEVPGVELRRSVLKVANADVLPRDVAERYLAFPAVVERDKILIISANPTDVKALDEIRFITGKRLVPHLGLHVLIQETIQKLYGARASGSATLVYGEEADPYVAPEGHIEIVTPSSSLEREPTPPRTVAPAGSEPTTYTGPVPVRPGANGGATAASPGPAAQSDVPAGGPAPAPAAAPAPGTPLVLVVDEDAAVLNGLQIALQERGFRVATAADGVTALQIIRDQVPDAIVLETALPGVHGFEICQKLRASRRFAQTPVVILAPSHRGDGYRRDVQTLYGADVVLEKPFPVGLLVRRLHELLTRSGRIEARADPPQAHAQEAAQSSTQLLAEGRIDEALEVLRRGLAEDPFSEQLHFQLGNAYRRKAMDLQALVELERAVELRPDFYPALQALAMLYQERGFRRKSFEVWERALEYCPEEDLRKKIRDHLLGYFSDGK